MVLVILRRPVNHFLPAFTKWSRKTAQV